VVGLGAPGHGEGSYGRSANDMGEHNTGGGRCGHEIREGERIWGGREKKWPCAAML
jgi:hypothetical protein